jgi:hypothetical protein
MLGPRSEGDPDAEEEEETFPPRLPQPSSSPGLFPSRLVETARGFSFIAGRGK